MIRLSALAALSALATVPAAAQPSQPSQPAQCRAELVSPASADRLIVRDVVWRCGGGICVAPTGNSRPAVLCAALARQAGALRSFAVEGRALSGEELEKCNARAR